MRRGIFALLFAAICPLQAQVKVAPGWSALQWGVEDGLPVNSINAMAQDDLGYLWLATMDGLVRFDGLEFKVFDSATHPALASNRLVLLERDGDALWLVSEDNRLMRYEDDRLVTMTQQTGLPDERVVTLAQVDGRWWVGTMGGAAWWNGQGFEALDSAVWPDYTQAIADAREGGVWLGSATGRLVRWRDGQIDVDLNVGGLLWTLTPDPGPGGGIWIGRRRGVAHWRDGSLQELPAALEDVRDVIRIEFAPDGSQYLHGSVTLYRFFEERLEILTETLNRSGHEPLILPLPSPGEFLVNRGRGLYQDEAALFSGLARIDEIYLDREESIWIATAGDGLYRLRRSPLTDFRGHPTLGSTPAYPIVADSKGRIWIGTGGAGFYIIDASGQVLETYSGPRPIDMIYSLLPPEIPGEAAWIGGLGLYRWQDGVYSQDGLPRPLSHAMVRAIFRDRAGSIWVGTAADGLWRLQDGDWGRVQLPSALSTAAVRSILEDGEGTLWMGTNGHGLLRWREGKFEAVGPDQGLKSLLVRGLHLDESGRLWIGTETHGLCRIRNPRDVVEALEIRCISRDQGLFHHGIHQILPDSAGDFWVSSNRGIFRVMRADLDGVADGRWEMLGAASLLQVEGLPNREANGGVQSAGTIGPDGRLWFPTMAGPVAIDADQIDERQILPQAHIDTLQFGAESHSSSRLPIELPVGQRDVSIRYTAPSFVNPVNLQFEFRLQGYDLDWLSAGTRRQIDYTNLPHGQYRFEVRALDFSGAPGPVASQALTLPRRLHETAGFRVGVMVLVVGLLALAWRVRELQYSAQRVQLENLVAERTLELDRQKSGAEYARDELARQAELLRSLDREKRAFFANISHELRTPMTLLLGPLEQAGEKPDELVRQGPVMLRNARRLNRLVEQILDLQKIEIGQIVIEPELNDLMAWVESLTELFRPLAERRRIKLDLILPPEGVIAWFDPLQMEKSFGNLLSNAIKYCRSGDRVEIRLVRDGPTPMIEVIDSGPGIAPEHLPKLFDRFYRAEMPGMAVEGTGIGLALARELVLLHGGELEVESELGQGTRFWIRWPGRAEPGRLVRDPTAKRIKSGAAASPSARAVQPAAKPSARILVVDDNQDLRAWLQHSLSSHFRIDEARDGERALKIMRSRLPDVVVTDWMMPKIDGEALIRCMREDPLLAGVPVILLTARAAVGDRLEGLAAGAVGFLKKPFNIDVLRAQIESVLDLQMRLRRSLLDSPAERLEAPPDESPWMQQVRKAIDHHLQDPAFGVQELAEVMSMDRTALFRRLREEAGQSPSALLREARLDYARELLQRQAGSISEIAYAVGFNSLDGFARAYRKHFGHGPSEARRLPSATNRPGEV